MNREIEIAVQAVLKSIQEEAGNAYDGGIAPVLSFLGKMDNITERDYTDTIEAALNRHKSEKDKEEK